MVSLNDSESIFKNYAEYYDLLYFDKNYERECDYLEQLFQEYSLSKPRTILDAGCGTGGHSVPLSKRGYDITGVDSSETMLRLARDRAHKLGAKVDFELATLQDFQLDKKFDACISMFAVIGYIIKTHDLQRAFSNIRRQLNQNALFVFDVWYAPAVFKIKPSPRMKRVVRKELEVIRFSESHLKPNRNICEVDFFLIAINSKTRLVESEVTEKHFVRCYFRGELQRVLESSKFRVLKFVPFLKTGGRVSKQDWNVTVIARAI